MGANAQAISEDGSSSGALRRDNEDIKGTLETAHKGLKWLFSYGYRIESDKSDRQDMASGSQRGHHGNLFSLSER